MNRERIKKLVLESGQCAHAKCIFCGYSRERKPVNVQRLKVILDRELLDFKGDELRIYSSGSFFDENQFPEEFRRYLAEKCREKCIKKLVVESRPEFIIPEAIKDFEGIELHVAIGLEVADDGILKKLNKGFTTEDYVKAAKILHESNAKLRTYLLANPPFVKDIKKSLYDSVEFAKKHSDSIVVINLLPHYRAPLFDLWLQGKWSFLSREEFRELTKDLKGVELDEETFHFVPRFPPEKKRFWNGVGGEYLDNPHYRVWQDYIARWYRVPEGKEIALFLPCSYKKPYSKSKTHTLIAKVLRRVPCSEKIHRIVISSPGVIPFEFNNYYPFNAYDWDESLETPEIKKEYIRVNKERIKAYLKNHKYKQYLCFLKHSSESYQALKQACEELGISLTNCLSEETEKSVEGNPLHSKKALEELEENLRQTCTASDST